MKDFAKSIRTENQKVGNAWTSVDEKRLNELLKKGPSKMTDEEWKEFQELNKRADQENAKALKKLGNKKVGNISADITTDGNTWFVTTSDGNKKEFTSEREAEEYVKKIKTGNKGRINYDDDLVVVKHNGQVTYQGLEDDEPDKYENWTYNEAKGVYELPGGWTKEKVGNKKVGNSLPHDYHNRYPSDPIYADMKSSAQLESIKKEPWRVYDIMGVGDSIARERVFEMIEEKYGIDYNDIYEAWLGKSWDKAVQKKSFDEAKKLAQKLGLKFGNKKTGNEMVHVVKEYYVVEDEQGETSQEFDGYYGAKRLADKWEDEGHETVHVLKVIEWSDGDQRVKVMNESIDKQTWSMFKGLSKDAEKEVGNEDIPTEQDLKNWIRMSQQDMKDAQREMEKNKPLGYPDSYREEKYGRAKVKYEEAEKAIKKMEEELRQGKYKKVGNESIGDEYNAEIYRLEKKKMDLERMGQGQKAREIEKQIQQLQKELLEYDIGNKKVGNTGHWDSKKMIYSKWDDEKGRPSDEYARITWLGEGKGGLAVVWRGTSMTGVKYGSNSLEDLRRWAEEKIGNETLAEYAKSKPRVINGTWEEPRKMPFQEKSLRYAYEKAKGKGLSGKKLEDEMLRIAVTTPHESSATEQEKRNDVSKWILRNGESSDFVNNLKRARNAMTKNAMSISDLEAQIKKNEEYIKSLQGKTVDSEGWSAKASIQEAQDEIDRMKSRIEELKKQGNKKG